MKKTNIATMSILIMLLLYAQLSEAAGNDLSLDDAIAIALENNNRYKIAKEKVSEKKLMVRAVWGELWPVLDAGASQTYWGAQKGILTGNKGETSLDLVKGSLAV